MKIRQTSTSGAGLGIIWGRIILIGLGVIASAYRGNFQDQTWLASFFVALVLAIAGAAILFWERVSLSDSIVLHRCGFTLLILGVIALLLLSVFPSWYRRV